MIGGGRLRRGASAGGIAWVLAAGAVRAEVAFLPRELFRIPFGEGRAELGRRVENERLMLPHEFTLDGLGRFYITDPAKHRIVRYSPAGAYEMGVSYAPTIRQVFAHADEAGNLWLLAADPARGVHYGVYGPRGQTRRSALFRQFARFRLHVSDDGTLRAILSASLEEERGRVFRFDTASYLLKPDGGGPPPEGHHRVRPIDGAGAYFIDPIPGRYDSDRDRRSRVMDEARRPVAEIRGRVIYITAGGEIYTRMGPREIRVYSADGRRLGGVTLEGLEAAAAAVRFDEGGNIYQLDGIPDRSAEEARTTPLPEDPRADAEDRRYTAELPGMRMIKWERR